MAIQPKFGFILEYVSDVEAAKSFYVDVLGLRVERYHPTYVQFEHFAIASDASLTGTRDPEIYWLVDDVEEAFKEISQKVEISVPLKQMPFGKVFAVKDTSGQPHFILEFSQNRPSQPVK